MKRIVQSLGLIALLSLVGCRSAVTSSQRANPLGTARIVEDKRFQPDISLRNKIAIVQVNEGIVSGDMTKVQVLLHNQKKYSLTVNYKFEWYDLNGMLVSASPMNWRSLPLAGSETKAVSAIGPTPNAVDFVLKVQEPRPFLKRNKLNPFTP